VELGYRSILVLTGSSTCESLKQYPFAPDRVVASVAELLPSPGAAEDDASGSVDWLSAADGRMRMRALG